MLNSWIDVHTHLNMLEMSPESALAQAKAVGIERVITIGTCPADHQLVLDLSERYTPWVFCTLGVHPHEASEFTPECGQFIRQHATHPRVLAVGEIGLDYYYNQSPPEVQQAAFRAQMQIAAEAQLPVEIHTRDAEADTLAILKEFSGRVHGLLHCFTGTQQLADAAIDLGYHISISGVVTFKNAQALRDVVKTIPLDRLHVETDAPFLAPAPHRGKKNHPALMIHTAQLVAELKLLTIQELCQQTYKNAQTLFTKLH